MTEAEPERQSILWRYVVRGTRWMFENARPQFQYSLLVLYHALWYVGVFWAASLLFRVFGMKFTLDFDFIGSFVGPLAAGGLVAGHIGMLSAISDRIRGWLIAAVFGGTTTATFWLVVGLRWNGFDWSGGLVAFAIGAGIFMLLYWLQRLEGRQKAGD